jgi:Zn finger protein HypA/HybF involved in hydrogenase expression
MLSVGREINIAEKRFLCRECVWEGAGPELSTGLVRISRSDIYLYSYRCPECGSYDVALKGKLLAFASRSKSTTIETIRRSSDESVPVHDTAEKTNRSWK